LVRKLCSECKQPYEPPPDELPRDFPAAAWRAGGKPLYKPVGCRSCRHTGYAGRMGLFELMTTTDRIRQLAHDRASSWQIKKAATEEGMRTLREDGWLKVLEGRTTLDEVVRVTKGEYNRT
jgi:general secretion pathway protein E/type IV pilus assembly protein PilB